MRSALRTTAVGAAISAVVGSLTLIGATPAAAATTCSGWDGTVKGWFSVCREDIADGDEGGVSGYAERRLGGTTYARAEFRANGEWWHITNNTAQLVRVFRYVNGSIQPKVSVAAGKSESINSSYAEGAKVRVQICVADRGCTVLDNLVA
ncbi:hypothetical protein [Streptomyces sp. NPDC047928]|uniref:hypothetical protein n=1 Tax=unclassified Streptomyces TaxID=2593676 RepID=UPI00371B7B3C